MCGIAGFVRMDGGDTLPRGVIGAMTDAITHRGPDDQGHLELPHLALGARRLSIVGLANGHQPISNEDGDVTVVFNGELYDFPETKQTLIARGHRFKTDTDTELLPHLWEDAGPDMLARLRGQFAFALYDARARRIVLARDRFGICPLYYTVQRTPYGTFLLFASEIKSLLASGLVEAKPDLKGIDHTFTFFALPGPITCFEGVSTLLPGRFLTIELAPSGGSASIREHTYWQIDFPDRGSEHPCDDTTVDRYAELFRNAVDRRLRADVPVVSYLSGGIDSSLVLAVASASRGKAPPSFTLQIKAEGLDESAKAKDVARHLRAEPTIIPCGTREILDAYPRLIEAAECPVSDTCCAALLLLAEEVHRQGFKVALTGEGSDETLAGYPWFKINRLLSPFDALGFTAGNTARRAIAKALGLPTNSREYDRRILDAIGGPNAWAELYGLVSTGKARVYGPRLRHLLGEYVAYEDLGLDTARMRRWHPLNRSLYLGQRIHLPGLLLSIAGDRVAMHSSLETRYPFLDEDLTDFVQPLDPDWKLRRMTDKYLLRRAAERHLPKEVAWRPKAMFRAPWDVLDHQDTNPYMSSLLTRDALEATGYFDAAAIDKYRKALPQMRIGSARRTLLEQALAGVTMTQLWHHMYISDLGAPVKRITTPAPALAA